MAVLCHGSAPDQMLMSITCSVLLEIQATLKTPPSARESMMKGIYLANAASGCCYFLVAVTGYSAFGNTVDDDVLASRPRASKGWITLANLMVECP